MTPAEMAYRGTTLPVDERNQMVMQELDQVYYIAARVRERLPQHVAMEDLVNAGVIGLLEASHSFDKTKPAQFRTFARFRIRGAILDSLRDLDWAPRLLRRKGRQIDEVITRLESTLGRTPTESEIAESAGVSLEELQKTLGELDSLTMIGQQISTTADKSETQDLIESAPSRGGDNPFDIYAEGELKNQLEEAVRNLSEREQLMLSLYYKEELTMKEVATVLGVAESRVSQMHRLVMAKLRASLSHLQGRVV